MDEMLRAFLVPIAKPREGNPNAEVSIKVVQPIKVEYGEKIGQMVVETHNIYWPIYFDGKIVRVLNEWNEIGCEIIL